MIAISMRNPHAAAVVFGRRDLIWRPSPKGYRPTKHRGPILIHCSQQYDGRAELHHYPLVERRGQVLGFAILVDIGRPKHPGAPRPWKLGRASMVFRDPVSYPGSIGEFDVPDDLINAEIDQAMPPNAAWRYFTGDDPMHAGVSPDTINPRRRDGYSGA